MKWYNQLKLKGDKNEVVAASKFFKTMMVIFHKKKGAAIKRYAGKKATQRLLQSPENIFEDRIFERCSSKKSGFLQGVMVKKTVNQFKDILIRKMTNKREGSVAESGKHEFKLQLEENEKEEGGWEGLRKEEEGRDEEGGRRREEKGGKEDGGGSHGVGEKVEGGRKRDEEGGEERNEKIGERNEEGGGKKEGERDDERREQEKEEDWNRDVTMHGFGDMTIREKKDHLGHTEVKLLLFLDKKFNKND